LLTSIFKAAIKLPTSPLAIANKNGSKGYKKNIRKAQLNTSYEAHVKTG
jgi:hypothetical protein